MGSWGDHIVEISAMGGTGRGFRRWHRLRCSSTIKAGTVAASRGDGGSEHMGAPQELAGRAKAEGVHGTWPRSPSSGHRSAASRGDGGGEHMSAPQGLTERVKATEERRQRGPKARQKAPRRCRRSGVDGAATKKAEMKV